MRGVKAQGVGKSSRPTTHVTGDRGCFVARQHVVRCMDMHDVLWLRLSYAQPLWSKESKPVRCAYSCARGRSAAYLVAFRHDSELRRFRAFASMSVAGAVVSLASLNSQEASGCRGKERCVRSVGLAASPSNKKTQGRGAAAAAQQQRRGEVSRPWRRGARCPWHVGDWGRDGHCSCSCSCEVIRQLRHGRGA